MSADGHQGHHMAHLDLMPLDANGNATHATHVAVNNGDWFNPGTWANGQVPGEGALVHIPDGVTVSYEGASDANLFMVRVDGKLDFFAENGAATKMVVDTMITSDNSYLGVHADAPTDGSVDIVFAEGSAAAHAAHFNDRSPGDGVIGRYDWDPEQLSLGLVASGKVVVKGQDVDAGIQLAEGPAAGATQLVFDIHVGETGWAAGQKVVIGGTKYLGDNADGTLNSQDEVRTITNIQVIEDQMVVTIDAPLQFDHVGPTNPLTGAELTGYVGNLSRNVTFSSEVADGNGDGMADRGVSLGDPLGADDHLVTQRGHVMFMHNDDVTVVDSAFFGLGRTDKSIHVDDFQTGGVHNNRLFDDNGVRGKFEPGVDIEVRTDPDEIMNQRGRYPLHLHEANKRHNDHEHEHEHGVIGPCPETGQSICTCGDTDGDGIDDCFDEDFEGAYLEGNVVWGSPGWGYVHHSSHAVMQGNLAYDVAGSSFVAELGDETGRWTDNLSIGTFGAREEHPTADAEAFNEDDGASGIGFYLKARILEVDDNVAQSSGRAGFFYHTNGADLQNTAVTDDPILQSIAMGRDEIPTEDVPLGSFDGNTVIAAREGMRITTDPSDAVRKFNDAWSVLEDYTAWEVDESGVSITYSSKYIFKNFLILGTEEKQSDLAQGNSSGFFFKTSVADITVIGSHVENFHTAVTNWSFIGDRQEYRRGLWDPKSPFEGNNGAEIFEGMGQVGGMVNPVYNVFNNNIVELTYDNLTGGRIHMSNVTVDMGDGETGRFRGYQEFKTPAHIPNDPGVEIELLGDSRDGGLVALWREDIAEHPDQLAMLQQHIPLAYQDDVYLNQIYFAQGGMDKRHTYEQYSENINADIWSGTILEFAKDDSLGRQVFLYGDFAPLDPDSIERTVTTNERLVISKEMVDGTLVKDGYVTVTGIDDVKFVVVQMVFTDRGTGETSNNKVLIALDQAWEMPDGTKDGGLLWVDSDMIVAPQYRVFNNGELVEGALPIVLGEPPEGVTEYRTGTYTTDADEQLNLGAESDRVNAGGGDDLVRGFGKADYLDGGTGTDALFGGSGWDRVNGGDGDDLVDGHLQRDFLFGGAGDDQLQGGAGRDELDGGEGDDVLLAGGGNDVGYGGEGNDVLDGGGMKDQLFGGAGHDQLVGGLGLDSLFGGDGDDVMAGNGGADYMEGGAGSDLMNGGAKADVMYGGDGADALQGDAGMDKLYGDAGNDLLDGQMGMDKLYGGEGDDALTGGAGVDRLFGGDGDDRLSGGQDNDRLTGGEGADRFVFDANIGNDIIDDFEDGVDAIEFMIEAFGFDDLAISQDGDDAVIETEGGQIRILDMDAANLDESDFQFNGLH